jgi:hypothetical protein
MLSGCSSCGGNKFQFKPTTDDAESTSSRGSDDRSTTTSEPAPPSNSGPASDTSGRTGAGSRTPDRDRSETGITGTVANAADTVKDWVGDDTQSTDDGSDWVSKKPVGADRQTTDRDIEDTAQADARSDIVDPDSIPESATTADDVQRATEVTVEETEPPSPDTESPPETEPAEDAQIDDEPPDLEALREELNQQFESIRIIAPGQYELNLMELYDREEYIISLLEDGRYAIEVPEAWRDATE